jgi:hypothetical protein
LAEVTSFMNSCECCIKDIFWFSSPWELIFELNLAALSGPLVDVKRGVYGREELSYGMRAPPIDRLSQRINLRSPFIDAHKASLPVECEQLQKTGSEVFIRQFCSEYGPVQDFINSHPLAASNRYHTSRVDRESDDLVGRSCPPAQESLKIKRSTK